VSSHDAAARRLRRLTATTAGTLRASPALIVEPLGDGSTRRRRSGASRTLRGERLTCPGRARDRPTARVAPCSAAKARARLSSPHGNGSTATSQSAATVTVVVKLRTSTTTATSQPGAIAAAPVGPHSSRSVEPA
jgi:hypothetical protein